MPPGPRYVRFCFLLFSFFLFHHPTHPHSFLLFDPPTHPSKQHKKKQAGEILCPAHDKLLKQKKEEEALLANPTSAPKAAERDWAKDEFGRILYVPLSYPPTHPPIESCSSLNPPFTHSVQ